MANLIRIYKNDGTDVFKFATSTLPTVESIGWSRDDYSFIEWNTAADGSGTSYSPGDWPTTSNILFAIWQEITHAVSILYNGVAIAHMDESGTKTIKTSGKYCEGDFIIKYTKES